MGLLRDRNGTVSSIHPVSRMAGLIIFVPGIRVAVPLWQHSDFSVLITMLASYRQIISLGTVTEGTLRIVHLLFPLPPTFTPFFLVPILSHPIFPVILA